MDSKTQKSYLLLHGRFLSACGSGLCSSSNHSLTHDLRNGTGHSILTKLPYLTCDRLRLPYSIPCGCMEYVSVSICRIDSLVLPVIQASSLRLHHAISASKPSANCTICSATTVRFWSGPLPNFRRFATIECEKDTPVNICWKQAQAADFVDFIEESLEARAGIEPAHKGFADLSLTTWVPRLGRAAYWKFGSLHPP